MHKEKEMEGIENLRKKLRYKKRRDALRYKYYESKALIRDLGISTPPALRWWMGTLGWCGKAVDSLSDRLVFDGFGNDIYGLNDIINANNKEILTESAILSALIASCSFIYITTENGEPKMRVIDSMHATGVIDPITMMLKEGYAVLEFDKHDKPVTEAYFTAGNTDIYQYGVYVESIPNVCPYPLLVPMIYRPDAVRPFGHSRITRACMSLVGGAIRTVKRSEIASEFFSFPQKFAVGLNPDEQESLDSWSAAMSAMLTFEGTDTGEKPTVGQFSTGQIQPHVDQLKMFASLFAGETGLTTDDLGFSGINPSSAEAIKASHENLRLTARAAQRDFGVGLKNAVYVADCLKNNTAYDRNALANVTCKWEPIFEPDFAALASIGDALYKLNEVSPDYIGEDTIQQLTGLKPKEKTENLFDPQRIDAEA